MVKTGYKQTEVGVIPEDWKTTTFDECFKVLSNNTLPRTELNYDGGTVQSVHYGDILVKYKNILDCSSEPIPYINTPRCYAAAVYLKDGDLIISDTAEDDMVGKAVELSYIGKHKVVSGLHTIPARSMSPGMFYGGWLAYYVNCNIYHDQLLPFITGTKVSAIPRSSIAKTIIVIPPFKEQQHIVQALSDADGMISSLEKLIAKYKSIKMACLQQMFPQGGETVPRMRLPGFTGAWEQRKLGDISGVYDGVHQTPFYTDSGIMFLSVENIGTLKSNKYISEEAFNRDYKVYPQKGDILMTRIGDVGTPNVVETSERVAFYVSLALLKPSNVDSYFLCNSIRSPFFQSGLKERTLITAIPQKINKDEIGNVRLFLPSSTDEQVKIGAFFQQLDNLITLHQRKLEKIQKIKQGMMQQLLTGKIRLV